MSRVRQRLLVGLLIVTVGVAEPSVVVAAGIRDLADGWLLGLAATGEFLGPPALSTGGAWVAAGHSRLYGMAELPVSALTGGVRFSGWPGDPTLTVGWQNLGEGLFQEHQLEAHLQLGTAPVAGLAVLSTVTQTGGSAGIDSQKDTHWQSAFTVQGGWRPSATGRVQIQFWLPLVQHNGSSMVAARQRLVRAQGWQGPLVLAAAVDLTPDQTPTVSLEWGLRAGGAACGLRADLATGALGPVLYLRRGQILVRSSHLVHPQLGVSHRLQVGLGTWEAPRW